jgi:Fur family ferric uptake transcriptional regulator
MAQTLSRRPAGRLRATSQAAALQEVLEDADGFRTVQELLRGAAAGIEGGFGHRLPVFESARRERQRRCVHHENGETQYRLCGSPTRPDADKDRHHHHLVCRECGRSVQMFGPEVEVWAERVAAAAGYTQVSHTAEIFGNAHSIPADPSGPSAVAAWDIVPVLVARRRICWSCPLPGLGSWVGWSSA